MSKVDEIQDNYDEACERSIRENLLSIGVNPEDKKNEEFVEMTLWELKMILGGAFNNGYVAGFIECNKLL